MVDVGRLTTGVVGLGRGRVVVVVDAGLVTGFVAGLVVGRLVLPPIIPPPVMPPGSCCASALLVKSNNVADKENMRGNVVDMGFSPAGRMSATAAGIIVKNGFGREQLM